MADIEYTYKDTLHTIDTYDGVINTYDWICNALKSVFEDREGLYIRCNVAFSCDELSYECQSIDEFKQYAFGKNIIIKRLLIYVTENWAGPIVDVFAAYHKDCAVQEFVLGAKEEIHIIKLREALIKNKKNQESQPQPVIMNIEDNSVHIGDNNHISSSMVGSKNTICVEQKTDTAKDKKETFLSKTFWQILVPIAVGVIVVAIAVWLELQ